MDGAAAALKTFKDMNQGRSNDEWVRAKRVCRLSDDEVRMARELGIGPRALIKNIPNPKQRWKAPVAVWIRGLYTKRIKSLQVKFGEPRVVANAGAHFPAVEFEASFANPNPPTHQEITEENERMLRRLGISGLRRNISPPPSRSSNRSKGLFSSARPRCRSRRKFLASESFGMLARQSSTSARMWTLLSGWPI